MAWLRIDDGFTEHPKLLELALADRWAWLEVLCYCARNGTDGRIPTGIGDAVKRATPALLNRAEKAGLIDRDEDGVRHVHDWDVYNGALGGRVEDYLREHPDASANEVHRAIGGRRNVVLALVAQYRETGTEGTAYPGTTGTGKPVPRVSKREPKSGTKSGTRARAPHPLEEPPTERALPGSLSPEDSSTARTPAPNGASALDELEPDPEGLARIQSIWKDANERAAAERAAELEQNARLDTPEAEARRAAAKAKLEELRANA